MPRSIIAIALVLTFPALVSAGSVSNGGFETGDFSGWAPSGDTSCTYVLAAGTGLQSTTCSFNTPFNAITHSGSYAAYLGPTEDGFLVQSLSTVAGETYTLDFWLASLSNPGIDILNGFHVSWNGTEIFSATDMSVFDFTQYTFSGLVASASETTLTVGGFYNQPSYFALDDVSVSSSSSVPEPASALPVGGALLLLATWVRKRIALRT
jgi:hypothetical protein